MASDGGGMSGDSSGDGTDAGNSLSSDFNNPSVSASDIAAYGSSSGNFGNTNSNNTDYTGQTSSGIDTGFGQGSYGADISIGDLPHSDPYNPNYGTPSSYLVPSDLGYGKSAIYHPEAQAVYQSYVSAASAAFGGDIPDFEKVYTSLIRNAESGFNPTADSGVAYGLAQINYKYTNPKTGQSIPDSLGINVYDPIENIYGGANLLAQYYHQFGNWNAALRAYNSGSPTGSTSEYVNKILDNAETATIFNPGDAFTFSSVPTSTPSISSPDVVATPKAKATTVFGIPIPKFMQPSTPGETPAKATSVSIPSILTPIVAPVTPSEQANAGGSVIGHQGTTLDPTPVSSVEMAPGLRIPLPGGGYIPLSPNLLTTPQGQQTLQGQGLGATTTENSIWNTLGTQLETILKFLTIENVFASLLIVFLLFMSTRALLQ